MPSLNNCEIMGHVGSEPEMRYSPNNTAVTNFSCAVNRKYTRNNGEKVEDTEWFNIVVWGKLAESVNKYVTKGMLIYASGRIHLHKWTGDDNQERTRLQLNAVNCLFLNKPSGNGSRYSVPVEVQGEPNDILDDDVPF